MLPALIIFLVTYLFLAGGSLPRLHLDRTGAAFAGAVARAGVFRWVGYQALLRARTAKGLLTLLVCSSAALSALLVNDTVCLMCTPLVLALIDDAELPPWPFLLALAFGSNAGSVATPIGNPQNMLVATLSRSVRGQEEVSPPVRLAGSLSSAYVSRCYSEGCA